MSCLKDTLELHSTLRVNQHNILAWHVDASDGVHADGKGHASRTLTMGSGAACNQSTKQKLNTRSSTKSELTGADGSMSQVLCTNYFLEAQGHDSYDTIVCQDNTSAILLGKNGKLSSSKQAKHTNN